ncbi:MAG: type II toxin-antitoxin system VapC family toxin [Acetobacteraceae bacterium]|nr:type II toxin-antitoxin system VapC family toxin [Acetobacteraceae bacterium]
MIVDASAMLAIALAEPDAPRLLDALTAAPRARMPAPTWLEATMVLDRRGDARAGEMFRAIMDRLRVEICPMNHEHAQEARRAWAVFGRDRHRARLNFGDCMVYAVAKLDGERLLFKGDDFIHTDIEPALKD